MRPLAAVLLLGACATGTRADEAFDAAKPPDSSSGDAEPSPIDARGMDTMPGAAAAALLITEVVLAPSTGEFVEIANPTAQTVDLSTYYLADAGVYFQLPAGAPTVDQNDFIVKFPVGASIAPGAVITVALDTATNFQTVYATSPSFSIASGTMTSVKQNAVATLTNAGEVIVLFHWDGQGDLVHDVDIVLAGAPSVANGLVDKSGQALDGPDADTATTAYSTDARTLAAQAVAPNSGFSTKRIALEAGHETQSGSGNGIAGDDETSEDTAATWDTTFTAPTPGTLPAGLL
ncbi:MAG: lamin tail domain-containing protein [Kofleriaceae bacterium]